MTDDDFKRAMLDFTNMAASHMENIMASLSDVKARHEALKAEFADLADVVRKAFTGPAAHSAAMDQVVADQDELRAMIKSAKDEVSAGTK